MMRKDQVLAAALMLSPEDRLDLLGTLWDSLTEAQAETPLPDELRAHIDARLADHERNPEDLIPWEEIKRES
jgi:putative addiction module component (TIGR02574 family)